MNEREAKKLVEKTFRNSFSKERFIFFVKNFLNEIDQDEHVLFDASVPNSYEEYVKSYERIGQYTDPEGKMLDVLSVNLRKETSPVRARTMQRNFIGWYLRNAGYSKYNALVAFYHENVDDWRFSYVKRDYLSEKDEMGKIKIREELTPAKRFSFLVGKSEPSHTAQNQIVPILRNDKDNPTISDIETAFNIETVTDEFFREYRDLFVRLKESLDDIISKDTVVKHDFETKRIDPADFAKKLLSQIVFLYFLQKKGWFGVKRRKKWGSGSKSFLQELFKKKHADYKNFFNDILEPLFYEALRVEHPGDYYKHFDCRIPFLNGGLFDPINKYDWVETEIHLPDEIFYNDRRTKKGDKGDGIFNIFDRYNFTVKEDEPLEKEVAVDPEMLGKVFENLLEVKDRKSKGTYYTPREIVHYMCKESLINYLETEFGNSVTRDNFEKLIKHGDFILQSDEDYSGEVIETANRLKLPGAIRKNAKLIDEKLSSIRICDPAVGSGAFVVGMMNEIIRVRDALTQYIRQDLRERNPYNFKREAIQNCLYGVDIDPSAVEIAKLRLWLSLVVDEHDRETVKPLPNLDYKIVRGNSLLGFPYSPQGLEKIEELKKEFFEETLSRKKDQLRGKIDKAIIQQLANTEDSLGYKVDFDFKIFFSEVFHEKDGFDVVIGNPPYVSLERTEMEIVPKDVRHGYETYAPRGNIYCLFYEKGMSVVSHNGVLCYISSNKWMRTAYGEKLREFFLKYNPKILIDLGPDVFKTATVDTNIITVQKSSSKALFRGLTLTDKNDKFFLSDKVRKKAVRLSYITDASPDAPWFIASEKEVRLKEKIESIGIPLKEWDITINYGIKTGCNDAFIIDNETKKALINKDSMSEKIIKPILRGKDIKRYNYDFADQYVILAKFNSHKWLPQKHPVIYEHLKKYENRLKQRGQCRYGRKGNKGQHHWLELDNNPNCDYLAELGKEKIAWAETAKNIKVAIVPKEIYLSKTCFFITGERLKYISGILNSCVASFYSKLTAPQLGSQGMSLPLVFMKSFPIPEPNEKQEKQMSILVNKILKATDDSTYSENSAEQDGNREKQIDQLVYELYHLTKEEIEILRQSK